MKRDKNFQNIVDETLTQGENGEFLQSAHRQIRQNKIARREKLQTAEKSAVASSASATQTESVEVKPFNRKCLVILLICALVIAALVLSISLTLANGSKITYSYTGSTRASSIEELNARSEIQFNDIENLTVSCAYDSTYNVDLFYIARYLNNDTYDNLTIIIETNADYKYQFTDRDPWDYTAEICGHTVNYCYNEVEQLTEEINLVTISGKITAEENLYITYEGLQTSGATNFIPLLTEIIK